ncbi:MAG: Ig-like domain-containing protein [Myxococcaceae bacterium]
MRRIAALVASLALCVGVGCGGEQDQTLINDFMQRQDELFTNGGFESGGGSLTGWTVSTNLNNAGLSQVPPTQIAHLQLAAGGTVRTFARTNAAPESQVFAGMTSAVGIPRWPKFDTTSAVINETTGTNSTNVNSLRQSYVVTNADVSPVDNLIHVRFVLAPALQSAGHNPAQQPYFFVVISNLTTTATLYTNYNYANNPGVPWKAQGTGTNAVLYTDWTIFDIAPGNANLKVGDNLQVEIFASRCQPSGHFGEVYVDGFGSNFPGLSIRKTAVAAADLDSEITYNFTVENNTSGVAPNVIATEVLPPNTTFVSVTPLSACSSAPPVGGTGSVICNFGYMNPSASATFQVKVRNYPPATNGTGTATNTSTTTALVDTTKAWTANQFSGYWAYITNGQAVGQYRTIQSNTNDTLTVVPAFSAAPNNTSQYKIVAPPFDSGTRTGATNTTLVDSGKVWTQGQWQGYTLTITSGGAGVAGQQRTILANTNNTLTVATWTNNPGAGATYAINLPPDKIVNGNYSVKADTISTLLGPRVDTNITTGVVYTNLGITVSNGVAALAWSTPSTTQSTSYTITVSNAGPTSVTGATVIDNFPAQLTGVSWTCTPSGPAGSSCPMMGSGNLNQLVNIASGGSVIFTVTADVIQGMGTATMTNIASVTTPAGISESDSSNNADADTDSIGSLFALTVDKNTMDSGLGTVTSSPAAINCGTACTTQMASFLSGTVVTLTAVARPGDTFTGWEGACLSAGTSPTCNVTVSAATSAVARFRGYLVTGSAGTGGTVVCAPSSVQQNASSTCVITPGADYIINTVTDNGSNVLGSLSGNNYVLSNITADHTVAATFDARPNFTNTPPTTAAQGTAYTHTPTATDADGPGPLAWSSAAGDTCGGTVNATTGQYAFSPGAGASCVIGLQVCDARVPPACRTQLTTVNINHAPVATDDTLSTSPNAARVVAATALTANDNAGGPASEQMTQTITVTAVSAASAQGGTVTLVAGDVTYTPPNGYSGTDSFTYTLTDDGSPARTATGTVNVTVTNVAPTILSMGPTTGTEGTPYTYNPTVMDSDGPGATWSKDMDTCGGTINPTTGAYTFTPMGPVPPASCVVGVRVCDGGIPNQCVTQTTTVTLTAVNNPPVVNSSAPTTATEDTPYTYNATFSDADGPSDVWTKGLADTCGGSINATTGVYTFTPMGPVPSATCVISVQVCDGAASNQCATQNTTVTVTAVNDPPVVSSMGPTQSTAGQPYTYSPTVDDPDGPNDTWTKGPADTCGGTVNASTGTYTFTPTTELTPTSCVVSIQVCDGATPALCATQDTTVTISLTPNQPPTFSPVPPTPVPGTGPGTGSPPPYVFDPSASDPEGATLTWTVGAGDTCGGTVDPATGRYTFTPPSPLPESCVLSVRVCDDGSPQKCSTQTTVIPLAAPGSAFAEGVGVSGGRVGGCSSSGGLSPTLLGAAGVLLLARRQRRAAALVRNRKP